ncbi:MAG: hypothetical protein AAF604_09385 [Acidobacteriota bacterium]
MSQQLLPFRRLRRLIVQSLACGCLSALLPSAAAALEVRATDKPVIGPVRCTSNNDLVIRGKAIITDGDAVELLGNCDVQIIDSYLVARGVAVRVRSNADVTIVDSFVQGDRGAVRIEGNGDVAYSGSTLRGGLQVPGIGDLLDRGGNTVETIPGSSAAPREDEPTRCAGRQTLDLVGQDLSQPLLIEDECQVLLSDSQLAASAAIEVRDDGSLRIRNSVVRGRLGLADGATVHVAGSELRGAIEADGPARLLDGGGNSGARWAGGAKSSVTGSSADTSVAAGATPTYGGGSRGDLGGSLGDLERGLEALAGTLGEVAAASREIAEEALEIPAAVAGNPWVGGWQVESARFGEQPLRASGRVLLYADGRGLSSYSVELGGQSLPQVGAFDWRRSGRGVMVETADGEIQHWRLVHGSDEQRTVALTLGDGIEAELRLRRLPR